MVQEVTDGLGWTTEVERVNALQSWLGSLPGHCYADVRRPLMNSLNVCDVMPLAQAWRGDTWNGHLDAPCLLQAKTEGSTPFALNLHQGDVGHTLVAGPTGAGKSTLLNLIAAQWMRYENAQVYFFDKGGSCRVLTYAMGGDFFDLSTSGVEEETRGGVVQPLGFQPLAKLDTDADRAWAAEWAAALMEGEGVRVDAGPSGHVWAAVQSLAAAPKGERTISGLHHLLQDKEAKEALAPFCVGGPFGGLFDAQRDPLHAVDADRFNGGRWQAFEMEELMTHPRAVAAALGYLFHALDEKFDGSPTLLVLDEAWLFLDHPLFRTKIREWLKVLRKRNVAVVFATQSLADVGRSDIAPAILESLPDAHPAAQRRGGRAGDAAGVRGPARHQHPPASHVGDGDPEAALLLRQRPREPADRPRPVAAGVGTGGGEHAGRSGGGAGGAA